MLHSINGVPVTGDSEETPVESVVDQLLALINAGELSPGERVDQRSVAERLQVSRTPLREALKALEADGILTHERNRGYTVTKLNASDLLQYLLLRQFIEKELAESVVWPNPAELAELHRIHDTFSKSGEVGDIATMAMANREFHFLIGSLSDKRVLFRELKRLWRITDAYQMAFFSTPESRKGVVREHTSILAALESRDKRRFRHAADAHGRRGAEMLQKLYKTQLHLPGALVAR
jgi:DNA-binding GntR family transcriptional regulator